MTRVAIKTNNHAGHIYFYDRHPKPVDFHLEVICGLSLKPRAIAPKFFYDETGSQLFEAICATPEYYPTRTEIGILQTALSSIKQLLGANCVLIEPGSGNSQKVRLLLDAIRPVAYVPVDISKEFLKKVAQEVATDYPWLDIHAICDDYTTDFDLPNFRPSNRKIAFFPGSSIGNFEPPEAVNFLTNVAKHVYPKGGLLIGVDLKKEVSILNAAYNDAKGVTAQFNKNLLVRINRELSADFSIDTFRHYANYNASLGRIEMHLVSECEQVINVGTDAFTFTKHERLHTENSYKYSIPEFQDLARQAGFKPIQVWTDPKRWFSLHYLEVES